ncbi:hypothetical protein ACFWPQ_28485 [Streptomyces sp. NPDC058464]|uniref:hypothetical protein n=1 Tax=Streptomyces sp. NPDC058464 TaxID=3346511 RepID=UPI003660F40B
MVNWTQMHDCYTDVDRVPVLLDRLEREDDPEAWEELGYRLVLEHDLVFPAGFAALPSLVRLASRSTRARGLAGAILRRAAGHHGCDDLLADCTHAITEFRKLLDQHLESRPVDFLAVFLDLLAAKGEYHWSAVLGGFTDDSHHPGLPPLRRGRDDRHRGPRAFFSDPGLEPGRREAPQPTARDLR